jgi:hypothetical protein
MLSFVVLVIPYCITALKLELKWEKLRSGAYSSTALNQKYVNLEITPLLSSKPQHVKG